MRLVSAFVLAVLALSSGEARASDISALFKDYGLFGTWAVDCKTGASPDNPHVTVSETEPGRIVERHDLGPRYGANAYRMLDAHRVSATRIAIETAFQPDSEAEQKQELVLSVRDGTRRTMFTQVAGGAVRVKDGAVVGHGVKTPTLRKCE
jgi:hypothetical protein